MEAYLLRFSLYIMKVESRQDGSLLQFDPGENDCI